MQYALPALAAADSFQEVEEWQQPNYFDALRAVKTRSGESWGHPIGIRAAADHSLCPALTLPTGVQSLACDGATCMAVCEEGKVSSGQRRTKCRFKPKSGFFWKKVVSPQDFQAKLFTRPLLNALVATRLIQLQLMPTLP